MQHGGGAIATNGTRTFAVAGDFGVPSSAVTAVVLNVTAVGAKGRGYLTVYPAGQTRPTASNLNFVPGQAVPNLVEVGVGTGGQSLDLLGVGDRRGGRPRGLRDDHSAERCGPLQRLVHARPGSVTPEDESLPPEWCGHPVQHRRRPGSPDHLVDRARR